MKHIQHLDELTYTAEGRLLLHKLLSSIRERDQSQSVKITSSRKFDGAPAIVFGRNGEGDFFLSTKAFFNATPIVCYSMDDIWKHFECKPELLEILLHVWENLHTTTINPKEVYQADLMFYGASEFGMLSEEYLFQPNLITYSIPMTEARAIGLCVHTQLIEVEPNSTDNNVKYDHIPANFSQNLVNNNVFIVQCDSSVFQSADMKGVAVHDELADKMDALIEDLEDIAFSEPYVDTLRMFDNALVRGEYVITDKCGYLANLTKFIAARMAKDIVDYKTDVSIFRCKRNYLDMIDAPGFIQIYAQNLYELRMELAGFKQSLMKHLDKYSPTNIEVLNGEHEGYVLYLDDSTVVKIVDRDDFSKKNFQKNGNKFSPK